MEILSYTMLKELVYVLPTFLIWACFSRWKALSVYLGAGVLHKVLVQYPYQRQLELEADEVGLQLAAKVSPYSRAIKVSTIRNTGTICTFSELHRCKGSVAVLGDDEEVQRHRGRESIRGTASNDASYSHVQKYEARRSDA